jgi:hypothetical protein
MSPDRLNFTFQKGVLHLTTPQGEMKLQWQPDPKAEKRLLHGRWEPFIPEFRILAPENPVTHSDDSRNNVLRTKQEAFSAFRASLPPDLVTAVEPFGSHQWSLLVLTHDSSSGPDLLHSNPVLAYALANNGFLQKHPTAASPFQAVRYSHRKQREILGWLGFPATDAMVRIFTKIPSSIIHPAVFRKLREAARNPDAMKIFSHLSVLNTGVIYLVSYPEMALLTSPRLIQEVAGAPEEGNSAPTADALQEIIILTKAMGRPANFSPFTSCRKVYEVHEQIILEHRRFEEGRAEREALAAEARRLEERQIRTAATQLRRKTAPKEIAYPPFPPPPIPGTDTIIPLTSFEELRKESSMQRNCVGMSINYAERVRKGRVYIYRVLAPQHHTLSIGNRGHNIWVIEELKRCGNAPSLDSARKHIQAWLNAHQVSL